MAQTYDVKWYRVNRKRPCGICGKPDWCGYSENASICMRVESDKPTHNSGWLHSDAPSRPIHFQKPVERSPLPNPLALWKGWERETDHYHLDGFAMSLGVDTASLQATGCVWARNAWAFPMRDHNNTVIGIRLRDNEGQKWAIKGSRQGLFIPTSYPYCVDDGTMYIVEGPTDLAAAMTMGLYSIGRPSCLGQEQMVAAYVRQKKVRRLVVIADNDTPGINGARKLQSSLPIRSCVWSPPCKDMREYLQRGGNSNHIESSIRDLVWKAA